MLSKQTNIPTDKTYNPCYQCTEREVGCHSTCEKHITWAALKQIEKSAIKNAKKKQQLIQDDQMYRICRQTGRKPAAR